MKLPFWDDFSFTHGKDYPNDSLWQYGHSVWVNDGMAINPPTIKVATFNGIDSLGRPYSISAIAKGQADKLVSRPLRLDLVDPAKRDLVFIFFYYQYEGNGEPPDPGDELSLWFKNDSLEWKKVWTAPIDTLSDKTKFVPVKLQIGDAHYFHDNFQFRFQNFARLSGPFDTWNLDYVYVNNGKSQYDTTYADFPDRAMATPPTSPFKKFKSIPLKHFIANKDSLSFPSFNLTNQRADQGVDNSQPLSYTYYATTTARLKDKTIKTKKVKLDTAQTIGGGLAYGEFRNVSVKFLPDFSQVDSSVDSLAVKFDIRLDSSDNLIKYSKVVVVNGKPKTVYLNDYDTTVYKGINFQHNDTTVSNFILKNYYAYDDGVAEYAVTLTQPGANLAYQFDLMYAQPDTLVAVDIYFPHVGDESDQVVLFKVWNDLSQKAVDSIALTIKRTENNNFVRLPLDHGILVKDKFFLGWKQTTTAAIGVGFDKNSDSGSKIFYNLAGSWVQNSDSTARLHGNLMIRPVFGNKDLSTITGVEEEKRVFAYPNPNRGVFYLPTSSQAVQLVDVAGRRVPFVEDNSFEQKQITISNPSTGLYFARYFNGQSWRTEKILVLP
jgi:hypothetical protein